MRGDSATMQMNLPKPGPVLRVVLIGLFVIWLLFAVALNWGGASSDSFFWFTGNTAAIAQGEVWRLLTASLLHMPQGTISHILSALLGLYFLGASLEESFGSRRFARFLLAIAILSYGTQFLVTLALGPSPRLAPGDYFGAIPVVEGIAIAWACSFRGRTVQLFFVLPVSSSMLILFVVGTSVLYLIAGAVPPSGHVAAFAGMGWGYVLGGSSPSPLRKFYLRYRLARLEAEAKTDGQERTRKAKKSGLRVIEGGKDQKDGKDDKHLLH